MKLNDKIDSYNAIIDWNLNKLQARLQMLG